MALHDYQHITRHVLAGDEPRLSLPTYAQTLPLANGVIGQALVPPHHFAFRRFHIARLFRQVAGKKFAKRTLADESDTRTIFFGMNH